MCTNQREPTKCTAIPDPDGQRRAVTLVLWKFLYSRKRPKLYLTCLMLTIISLLSSKSTSNSILERAVLLKASQDTPILVFCPPFSTRFSAQLGVTTKCMCLVNLNAMTFCDWKHILLSPDLDTESQLPNKSTNGTKELVKYFFLPHQRR